MKLIYHIPDLNDYSESIFDLEIKSNFRGEKVKITSPYFSYSYLNRIIGYVKPKWKIITDINSLFSSIPQNQRLRMFDLIESNHKYFHHNKSLHAKTIISKSKAMLGSANFTESGIKFNNELSVLIDEKETIEELNDWFDAIWNRTQLINLELLESIIHDYPKNSSAVSEIYTDSSNQIKTKFSYDDEEIKRKLSEREVIQELLVWNDKEWLNYVLDLIKEVITNYGLLDTPEKFVLTMSHQNKMPRINFTIGQRYVLSPRYISRDERVLGLIASLDYDTNYLLQDRIHESTITAIEKGKNGFTNNKIQQAYWLDVKANDKYELNGRIKKYWLEAIETEIRRTKRSSYKKSHQKAILNVAIDNLLRTELMNEVKPVDNNR